MAKHIDWTFVRIALAFILASTLLNVGAFFAEDYAPDGHVEWLRIFVNEFTGGITILVLLLPLILFYNRFPIQKPLIAKKIFIHILGTVVFGVLFFIIMYGQRFILYPALDLRTTEVFNNLHIRFLMEFAKLFFYYWVWYIGYHFYQLYKERRNQELALQELKNRLLHTELQALQNRLNPHFFFNTLNVISSLMYDDPEKADKLIVQLSSFLRKVIGFHENPVHSIQEELDLTDQYLALMQARYEENLIIKRNIEVENWQCQIPAMTFQPFLENAIQYTLDYQSPAVIHFEIQEENARLVCVISDNGPGISDKTVLENGVGVTTVIDRLNKYYGDDFKCDIGNLDKGGTIVQLVIPII